jgi:hypothetical protein
MHPSTSIVVRSRDLIFLSKGRISPEAVRSSVTNFLDMMASSAERSDDVRAALRISPLSRWVRWATIYNVSGRALIRRLRRDDLSEF